MLGRAPAEAAEKSPEFEYTHQDFERIRRLIRENAGIKLDDSKRAMVYSRLVRRLRQCAIPSFREYLDRVEADPATELDGFVNALTTNLTCFYREPHHFAILQEYLQGLGARGEARVWCAGCSTGEEAYTLAMVLAGIAGSAPREGQILASDIDTRALEHAAQGIYSEERVQQVPRELLKRHFLQGTGSNSGLVKVRPELKRLIAFARINLHDASWPVRGALKAIFCRNVMIYFDPQSRHRILQRFAALLVPGGLLFAGHSENFSDTGGLFQALGRTVYRRSERPLSSDLQGMARR